MSVVSVNMSVTKTVQYNPDEFVDLLPAHGIEWRYSDTELSWGTFHKLRSSGDTVLMPVRKEDDYTVWMTSKALDECVRRFHGDDVLVEEIE